MVDFSGAMLSLPDTLHCATADTALLPLLGVMDYEYRMRAGGRVAAATDARSAGCGLRIDPSLAEEQYELLTVEGISISGGSYRAVAMGSVTLMQSIRLDGERPVVPVGRIADEPPSAYRGLLVDVARAWHDVETLEQLVLLARWYKINYLQLHLTDDQLFTFPTESYPLLPTPGRHYGKDELRRLDVFARQRGVTLVPELEVPGHAGQMVARMPELFGIRDWELNRGTINIGREAVYKALDRIVSEIADVFRSTPYIHVGGDEASLAHLDSDPDVRRSLAAHGLPDVSELYRLFLVRMNEIVKRHGKRTIVWEGFHRTGMVEIPRDILVMAWETIYQLPQDLLANGYTIVNASWKPLYVVNEKKWDPEYIYGWNLYRWENWVPRMPSFTPIQLAPSPRVIGASMSSWAQPQHLVLHTLRKRLPAMSERAWSRSLAPERPLDWFLAAVARTDSGLQEIISPVAIRMQGLRFPGLEDGHENEQDWFGDTLSIALAAPRGLVIRYTTDGAPVSASSPRYREPIVLSASTSFRARAFTPGGEPVGYTRWRELQLRPLVPRIEGALKVPLDRMWEGITREVEFADTLIVHLSSMRRGTIRYTTDGTEPSPASPVFSEPLVVKRSVTVRAQLFDADGRANGYPWVQGFTRQD